MPDPEVPQNLSEYEALLGEPIPVIDLNPEPEPDAEPEPAPEPEPEPQAPPKAERDEAIRERQMLKQKADELESHNRQLQMAYFQAVQNAQRNALPGQQPVLDPEVEAVGKYLAPWLQQQMQPLVQTIQQQQQMLMMLQGNAKVSEAFDYVKSNVPEFDSLLPYLEKWRDAKPAHIRERITADPDLIINEALIVRELKHREGGKVTPPSDVRQRAKVEGPGPGGTSPSQKTSDVSQFSDAQFAKMMQKAGFY